MTMLAFLSDLPFPLLPLLIFLAELTVVTLGTLRIIFLARGMKYLAPLLGFFEVTIWLFAIGQIMQNVNDPVCYAAFAGGFTTGNFLGIFLEQKLALGKVVVRTITSKDTNDLVQNLRDQGYGVTRLAGQGATGPVQIVFSVIKRKELGRVVDLIKKFDARAFYSVDDLKEAAQGVFPEAKKSMLLGFRQGIAQRQLEPSALVR